MKQNQLLITILSLLMATTLFAGKALKQTQLKKGKMSFIEKVYETKQVKLVYPDVTVSGDQKMTLRVNTFIKNLSGVSETLEKEKTFTGKRQYSIICNYVSLLGDRVLSFKVATGYHMMKKHYQTVNLDLLTGRSIKLNEVLTDQKLLYPQLKAALDHVAASQQKNKLDIVPMDNIGVQGIANKKIVYDENGLKSIIGMFTIGKEGITFHFAATTISAVLLKYCDHKKLFSTCLNDLLGIDIKK